MAHFCTCAPTVFVSSALDHMLVNLRSVSQGLVYPSCRRRGQDEGRRPSDLEDLGVLCVKCILQLILLAIWYDAVRELDSSLHRTAGGEDSRAPKAQRFIRRSRLDSLLPAEEVLGVLWSLTVILCLV